MSEAQPSSETNGDTADKHCDATILRDLGVGSRILVDDRDRPLVVRDIRRRDPPHVDDDAAVSQTVVIASGDWKRAAELELFEEIHIRGELTGRIVTEDGRKHQVRQAPPSEPADFGGGESTGVQDL